MRTLLVLCAALGSLATGCGYRFTAGGASLPEGVRHIYAPMFVNRTAEPGVEALFTQAFREQLVRAGVDGKPDSEAQVTGEILGASSYPTIIAPSGRLASYRASVFAVVRLVKGGRVLAEVSLNGTEDYQPGADMLLTESTRQAALRRLADSMMRDAYDRLTNGM